MRAVLVAFLLIALAPAGAAAQAPAGDPQAGKAIWEGPATQCKNCHGNRGEGAYGPDLAGRGLSAAQFRRAVRQPWGVMPAFVDVQVSDKELADMAAYFASLPANAQPGPWRVTPPPANSHPGLRAISETAGCAQCHGVTMNGPRADLGAINADIEWLKGMVYRHSTAMPEHWTLLTQEPAIRIRMGNFNPARVPENILLDIYNYMKEIGFKVPVQASLDAGAAAANGTTYTLTLFNNGLPGRGLSAEDMTILLFVPEGTTVAGTTGAGYQGVRRDEQAKQNAAIWTLAKLNPKDRLTYTITLSKPVTREANLSGAVRWNKPEIKPGPGDAVNIAPAPLQ